MIVTYFMVIYETNNQLIQNPKRAVEAATAYTNLSIDQLIYDMDVFTLKNENKNICFWALNIITVPRLFRETSWFERQCL